MNKLSLIVIALLCAGNSFAQKIVERKNKLTGMVQERFQTVIETDKQVKQGQYRALYDGKTVVAMGGYAQDKKKGIWRFYGTDQKVIQVYDFDKNVLIHEEPESPNSPFTYVVDRDLRDSDKTTKPVRVGGRYFGYVPYLRLFRVPKGLEIFDRDGVKVVLEILVSPMGRLADLKIHMYFDGEETIQHVGTEPFAEEDKIFIPATINKEQVASRIFVNCYINEKGEADI